MLLSKINFDLILFTIQKFNKSYFIVDARIGSTLQGAFFFQLQILSIGKN